jgi:hypothetical protein
MNRGGGKALIQPSPVGLVEILSGELGHPDRAELGHNALQVRLISPDRAWLALGSDVLKPLIQQGTDSRGTGDGGLAVFNFGDELGRWPVTGSFPMYTRNCHVPGLRSVMVPFMARY